MSCRLPVGRLGRGPGAARGPGAERNFGADKRTRIARPVFRGVTRRGARRRRVGVAQARERGCPARGTRAGAGPAKSCSAPCSRSGAGEPGSSDGPVPAPSRLRGTGASPRAPGSGPRRAAAFHPRRAWRRHRSVRAAPERRCCVPAAGPHARRSELRARASALAGGGPAPCPLTRSRRSAGTAAFASRRSRCLLVPSLIRLKLDDR